MCLGFILALPARPAHATEAADSLARPSDTQTAEPIARTTVAQPAEPITRAAVTQTAEPTPRVVVTQAAPDNFRLLDPWLDYKRQARFPGLPAEARIFYRRGLLAFQSKQQGEALRLVRGAVELDPSFLAARVTLLRWQLFADPSQALAQAAGIVDLVRRDFATQWSLAVNAGFLAINAWMLAILLLAALILLARSSELQHAVQDRLGRWSTPASSHTWAWILLCAPFVVGLGFTFPVVVGLGLLWPMLKPRERTVWVLLVLSVAGFPYAARKFDTLTLPMREESTLSKVLPLGNEPFTPERAADIERYAAAHPHDPFARFGEGWMALWQADGATAEAAYRDVLNAWPNDDRTLDNLGTALVLQGRRPEAIQTYEKAVTANPTNATAFFNLSQAYLAGFEFAAANKALARASSLDFDRVREYRDQPATNGALNPVPDWISPARQWRALRHEPSHTPLALPPAWQGHSETAAPRFGWIVLVAGFLSVALGGLLNKGLPLYHCVNCDRVVCRRCAERRRAQAMCANCARVARGAASNDFSRILLARERERSTRVLRGLRLALALAMPGAGLVMFRRTWRALLLLLVTATVFTVLPGSFWPYAGRARMGMEDDPWCLGAVVPLALVCGLSLWAYFAEQARIARREAELMKPMRSKPRASTQVHDDGSQREVA